MINQVQMIRDKKIKSRQRGRSKFKKETKGMTKSMRCKIQCHRRNLLKLIKKKALL